MRIRIHPSRSMLDISKDIRSLTEFKRETPKFLVELKSSGRALA